MTGRDAATRAADHQTVCSFYLCNARGALVTDPANVQTANTQTEFKKIAVDQIHPNPFNPNKMNEEEFYQYVEEVEHLERLPKPVIVRPLYDGY